MFSNVQCTPNKAEKMDESFDQFLPIPCPLKLLLELLKESEKKKNLGTEAVIYHCPQYREPKANIKNFIGFFFSICYCMWFHSLH